MNTALLHIDPIRIPTTRGDLVVSAKLDATGSDLDAALEISSLPVAVGRGQLQMSLGTRQVAGRMEVDLLTFKGNSEPRGAALFRAEMTAAPDEQVIVVLRRADGVLVPAERLEQRLTALAHEFLADNPAVIDEANQALADLALQIRHLELALAAREELDELEVPEFVAAP